MKQFKIRFFENRKIYYGISIGILLVGILFNMILGAKLDIEFRGGTQIKYSYTDTSGAVKQPEVEQVVKDTMKRDASVLLNKNVKNSSGAAAANDITIELSGTDAISVDQQQALAKNLNAKFANCKFALISSNSINPTMGQSFFLKCLVAVAIAVVLLLLYVALRFRKIGGLSAGCMAVVALLHDLAMVYFAFIFFQFPINGNFIAVALTILGYSLNDTIIVFDRVRENRRELPQGTPVAQIVDLSINQTLTRSIFTALCTVIVIACLCVVSFYYQLTSVVTIALPMMIGVITGCYSSVCIAGPLYVGWMRHKGNTHTGMPAPEQANEEA